MFKLVASGVAPGQFGLTKGNVINSRGLTRKENSGGFKEQPSTSLLYQVIRESCLFILCVNLCDYAFSIYTINSE